MRREYGRSQLSVDLTEDGDEDDEEGGEWVWFSHICLGPS
jgi:hypothetical protein